PNALLDYLYEEGDAADRLKIARHLQDCATCSVAVLELQSVRGMLSQWTPPAAELGFKVVRDPASGAERRKWHEWLLAPKVPMWGQGAVGLVLFVAGFAFSTLHVEYANGAVTLRTNPAPVAAAHSITLAAEPIALVNASTAAVPTIENGSQPDPGRP